MNEAVQPRGGPIRPPFDQLPLATGQAAEGLTEGLAREQEQLRVDMRRRASEPDVRVRGNRVVAGPVLAATAVAQGRDAAEDVPATLIAGSAA